MRIQDDWGVRLAEATRMAKKPEFPRWRPVQGQGHRARQRLIAVNWAYNWMYKTIALVRSVNDWPDVIFFPRFMIERCVPDLIGNEFNTFSRCLEDDPDSAFGFSQMLETGIMFSTWRMTQGIYRFDETLYSELIQTKISGEIPADVLLRLPEWCVYVETPGMKTSADGNIYGAWARIDLTSDGEMILAIMPDSDAQNTTVLSTQYFLVSQGSIEQSILATLDKWFSNLKEDEKQKVIANAACWAYPIINLLLYLCSGADYAERSLPCNPLPKKTKQGPRIFAANKPTSWDVGVRMGAALRAAYAAQAREQAEGDGTRSVRPHIRRAHWHGFRSGPRFAPNGDPIPVENRPFDLRWLPPIPINVGDDELPSVVRPVKGK